MELARVNGQNFIDMMTSVNDGDRKMDLQIMEDMGIVDSVSAICMGLTRVGEVKLRIEEIQDPDTEETTDMNLIVEVDSDDEEILSEVDSAKEEFKAFIVDAMIAKEEEAQD